MPGNSQQGHQEIVSNAMKFLASIRSSNSEFWKGIWNTHRRLTPFLFIYMLKSVFIRDISVEHGFKQCVEI